MSISNVDPSTQNELAQDTLELADKSNAPEQPVVESSQVLATQSNAAQQGLSRRSRREFLWLAAAFATGLSSGYILRGWSSVLPIGPTAEARTDTEKIDTDAEAVTSDIQVNLPVEYTLPVSYGNLGPQLLESQAIDYNLFTQVYEQAGQPLTEAQLAILTAGSDAPVVINRDNAYFLLNFFWALGLTSQNPILTEGTMMQYGGEEKIGSFASTGGWTIGAKPVTELYASTPIITFIPEQQARLEEVANAVYRPCCNNPTAFPDCNHGMAMLGVLELMASQDVTVEEMFTAAKYINAFWFPQQTLEIALVFKHTRGQDFAQADGREFVSANFSSGAGFQAVHQWLANNDLLKQGPSSGNGCGV